MNDKKVIELAKHGLMLDTVAKFYELVSQADSFILEENYDDFLDWLDDIKCLHFKAQSRVDEIRDYEVWGVSA